MLKKEIHYQTSVNSKFLDLLVGEYQYIENGIEKANTLSDFNNSSVLGYQHKISGGVFTRHLPNYCIDNSTPQEIKINLKIDDIATLISKLDTELANTKGATEKDKEINLNKVMQKKYKKDSDAERAFLKKFKDYGISLFKANDQNLSNWSKLQLDDPTATNPNVNTTPCL